MGKKIKRDVVETGIGRSLLAGALVLAVIALVNHLQISKLRTQFESSERTRGAITAIEEVSVELLAAQSSLFNFLLTSQQKSLVSYRLSVAAVHTNLDQVGSQLRSDDQRARYERFSALATGELEDLDNTLSTHDKKGNAAALDILRKADHRNILDEVRSLGDELIDNGQAQGLIGAESSDDNARITTEQWLWAIQGGLIALFALGFVLLRRELRARRAVIESARVELREGEDQLRVAREFISRTKRAAGLGGWELDIASGKISWSDEVRRIHGIEDDVYSPPTLESALRFVPIEARPQMEAAIQKARKSGRSWDLELPLITATRRHIWVRAVGQAEFAGDQPVRLTGAFQDITERKTAELKFQRSERNLRAITDNIPAVISQFDREQRCVFANEQFRHVYGMAPAEVLGKTQREFRGETVYQEIAHHLEAVLRGEARSFEVHTFIQDREYHLRQSLVPEVDPAGIVQGYFSMVVDITDLRRGEQLLQASERRLRLVTDSLPALIAHVDKNQRYTFVNEQHRRMLGIDPKKMLGRTLREVRGDAYYKSVRVYVERALEGQNVTFEASGEAPDGAHHYRSDYLPDIDAQGRLGGFYAMSFDFTDRKNFEEVLAQKERMLRTITDNLPVMIAYIDRDERLRFMNATGKTWMGLAPEVLVDQHFHEVIGARRYEEYRVPLFRALSGERVEFEFEETQVDTPLSLQNIYVPDRQSDGTVAGVFALTTDITQMKTTQRQLDNLARVDVLTGLPNRRQFDEKLGEALMRSRRSQSELAVMFLDIDHFKEINDVLGHASGDIVLCEFGARLKATVRATDLAARLAGDEFVVVLEGIGSKYEAELVAQKIVTAMRVPFAIGNRTRSVTTSLGVAFAEDPSVSAEQLLSRADEALYKAKSAGRDGFRVLACVPDSNAPVVRKVTPIR